MNYKIRYTGRDDSDSLQHWKYIRKKLVNGRWRYVYDDGSNDYDNKAVYNEKVTTKYRNVNKLLSSETSIAGTGGNVTITKNRGTIAQTIDKGKDWVDKKVFGKEYYDKYDNNYTSTRNVTTRYTDSKKNLLSSTHKVESLGRNGYTTITKERGLIAQQAAKGKRKVQNIIAKLSKKIHKK